MKFATLFNNCTKKVNANVFSIANNKKFFFQNNYFNESEIKRPNKFFLQKFKQKLKVDEIREELMDTVDIEEERKITPQKIKEELDKYVIGQEHVKRAIAIALRSRFRKRLIPKTQVENMRSHNMLISGKSGSGKTEILRQTAKLCSSPFIKVESVRYTEVGYHGDDVENIISDLYKKTKNEFFKSLRNNFWNLKPIKKAWENFILSYLLGKEYQNHPLFKYYSDMLHSEQLDKIELQLWIADRNKIDKIKIEHIKNHFYEECFDNLSSLIDFDEIIKKQIEERAIVCIDEFDKLIKDKTITASSKASDEGVQNDFLPLLDGTDVQVLEGKKNQLYINTRNILFVAVGAFVKNKPEDLIVEVQGRLPNQVEVKPLTREDFVRILKETKDNILSQAISSLKTEGILIKFSDKAIDEIAFVAEEVNRHQEDTGARRLVSIIDLVLEDISFNASEIYEEHSQPGKFIEITIDEEYIRERCEKILKKKDLRKNLI